MNEISSLGSYEFSSPVLHARGCDACGLSITSRVSTSSVAVVARPCRGLACRCATLRSPSRRPTPLRDYDRFRSDEVFDWDLLTADDFVGGCDVPLSCAFAPDKAHQFELANPGSREQVLHKIHSFIRSVSHRFWMKKLARRRRPRGTSVTRHVVGGYWDAQS